MVKNIRKILVIATIVFLGFLTNTTLAAKLNIEEFKEEVENINKYADYVYIIGKYAFTSASQLNIQDVMLSARSIQVEPEDGETNGTTVFGKMTIHELEPILDENDTTIGWKIVDNIVGDTKLLLDKENSINIEYIDYNKLVNKYRVTFKNGYDDEDEKIIKVEENKTIQADVMPQYTRNGYQFKGWYKPDGTEFKPGKTQVTEDMILVAKWYEIVDMSNLLNTTVDNKGNDDYVIKFDLNSDTVIFNVYNKAKNNIEIKDLMGDIVKILTNKNVKNLKFTCKGVSESENYVEFTEEMINGGSDSQAWTKLKNLLSKVTDKGNFSEVTLGDLVNIEDIQLDFTLDTENAVANNSKTTFNIKFIELVKPSALASSVVEWLKEGKGYTATYNEDGENRIVTIKMDNPQEKLSEVKGSNILAALGNMLNDNVSFLEISLKNGEQILIAKREELKDYDHQWLEEKLATKSIKTNMDLLDKEFTVKVNLDEKAKVEATSGKIIIYNIVFTVDKFTVTFDNGVEQTTQTVIKGEKITRPDPPKKEGYEFQHWENEADAGKEYNFETPVTGNLKLKAVFKKVVETDALVQNAVKGIKHNDFKASYDNGIVTIDITGIHTKLANVKNTNIMVRLGEILKTEGVKSVKLEFNGASTNYDANINPNYDEMKKQLQEVLAKGGTIDDLYGLVGKELKVTIEVTNEAIKKATAKDSKAEYTVKFTSDYARAINKETLKQALEGTKRYIVIGASFEVDEDIDVSRNVTIINNKENTNIITRKGVEGDTHVFKIFGDGINVTLENLQLEGASSAVLVENKATVTANNLKVEDENYNKPAIAVKTEGNVANKNNFTSVDTPYKVTKGEDTDELTKIEGTTNYYINGAHSKLYTITFRLTNGTSFRFCTQGEKITPPSSKNKIHDNLENGTRYTLADEWKASVGESIKNSEFPNATTDVTYYATYTETPFTKVTSKDELVKKIKEIKEGLPIIIESSSDIDIDNLKIDTNQPVTLIGKGNFKLKGTITATSQVPSLSLHKLKIVGDGNGNKIDGDSSNRYYIVKSEAKKFTMWQSTVSNGESVAQAYSAIYLPVDNVVADIRLNTFNVKNIYNTIEFGYGKAVGNGIIISNNSFVGKDNTHNHINIYTVQEGAKITIERNNFDISANAIRLSNTSGASAEFAINKNTYNETDSNEQHAGFIVMQMSKENSDEFSKYTITSSNNKGPNGTLLTDSKSDKKYRFEYYASADGKTVYDNLDNGKNAKITFKNS